MAPPLAAHVASCAPPSRSTHSCVGLCCSPLHRNRSCHFRDLLYRPPNQFAYLQLSRHADEPLLPADVRLYPAKRLFTVHLLTARVVDEYLSNRKAFCSCYYPTVSNHSVLLLAPRGDFGHKERLALAS